MASSATNTIEAYIAGLPLEQREVVSSMRRLVNAHMPPGYEEVMNWGMISWQIPLARYPVTYNKQPLSYVALAARKNTCALHLMGVYADGEQEHKLLAAAAALGKKLDKPRVSLLKAELEAHADKRMSPRLWAKEVA